MCGSVYVHTQGDLVDPTHRLDGHKLQVKAVISIHRGPDRDWVICRNLLHTTDAALTDAVVGDKRPFLGKAELIATEEKSVVETHDIICKHSRIPQLQA